VCVCVCVCVCCCCWTRRHKTPRILVIVPVLLKPHAIKTNGEMPVSLRHRSRWIISLTPSPLYPQGNSRNQEGVIIVNYERCPIHTRNKLGRPQNGLNARLRHKYLPRSCLPVKEALAVDDLMRIKWNSKSKKLEHKIEDYLTARTPKDLENMRVNGLISLAASTRLGVITITLTQRGDTTDL
jgi:hypothetical protein